MMREDGARSILRPASGKRTGTLQARRSSTRYRYARRQFSALFDVQAQRRPDVATALVAAEEVAVLAANEEAEAPMMLWRGT
jgi:polyphosphate kinase